MNKSQTWLEVTIPCSREAMEAVENFLFELGSCGLEEGRGFIKGYFVENVRYEKIASPLNIFLQSLRKIGFSAGNPVIRGVPLQDWSIEWREHFKPIRITSRILIKPPWESWEGSGDDIIIDIMPRMAFGMGTHETTRICIELLEDYIGPSDTVLDIGTGSGILAIIAAKLNASDILAIDIDEDAVENARENVRLNHVEHRVRVRCASVEAIGPQEFNLILANIDRNTITIFLPELMKVMNTGSRLILSGILMNERHQIENELVASKYRLVEMRQMGEWLGLVAQTG